MGVYRYSAKGLQIVSCAREGMLEMLLVKITNSSHFLGEESMLTFGGVSVARLITLNKVLELRLFFSIRSEKYRTLTFLTFVLKLLIVF